MGRSRTNGEARIQAAQQHGSTAAQQHGSTAESLPFWGFTSLWMTFTLCRYASAWAVCEAMLSELLQPMGLVLEFASWRLSLANSITIPMSLLAMQVLVKVVSQYTRA
jgi:hypothetical protein